MSTKLMEPGGPMSDKTAPGSSKRRTREFRPAGARGDDPITRNLKKVYEQVAAEPIPPHLLELLDKLGSDEEGSA